MQTARDLLDIFLATRGTQPDAAIVLFADDGLYEAPYLESLGMPWRYRGLDEVGRYLHAESEVFRQLAFHDVVVVADTGAVVVAEYQFTARSTRTARMVHQLIVGRLDAVDGRITRLRESLNLVEVALALFPDGLSYLRVAQNRGM